MSPRVRVPAVEGWFTVPDDDSSPRLIGSRCESCGTFVFPSRAGDCPNPSCESTQLVESLLSSVGTVWSYTENHYAPPPPFIAADPFVPYGLAAVEMEAEGLIVLGQLAVGLRLEDLRVGQPMRLGLGVLYTDDDGEHLMHTWEPA